jgi:natural product biosynthesis luciferase-like monooxygenase protein
MEFSLFFFADDSQSSGMTNGRYDLLLEAARFADSHDFEAVWTPERHFHPFGGLYPNPSVAGAAVAAVTERVGIRAGSVVAPLQDPLRIAEEWSVVDNISGGRAAVSFASGWHPHDFVLNPQGYDSRQEDVIAAMKTVRQLWRGEPVTRVNGLGEEIPVRAYPPPVQRELPMWLTSAGSTDTFRLAGEMGAGVLTHLVKQGVDALAENIAVYREAFRLSPEGAAIPSPGRVTLMMHTLVGPDDGVLEEARGPMRAYVAGSLGLFGTGNTASRDKELRLSPQQQERLIDASVDRYFRSLGLFGATDKAIMTAEKIRAMGVDEIACLIDFGAPVATVLAGLDHLDLVRRAVTA